MLATKMYIPSFWLHLLIQLGFLASFTVSNPYLQHAISPPSSSRTEKRNQMGQNIKVCGSDLSKKLGEICELFYSPLEWNNNHGDLMEREGVYARCCRNECSETILKSYCKKVRNRTISQGEEQQTNLVDEMEQVVGVLVVPPPPTDPPNVPEYVYAGEYWDQEPLTLISTYTSPEYSTNQLFI